MAPNLAHPSSAVRVANLRLLCRFQQPLLPPAGATEADKDQNNARSAIFPQFLQIESQVRPLSLLCPRLTHRFSLLSALAETA